MDKIKILAKIKDSENHYIYKIAFRDDISDWHIYRDNGMGVKERDWYVSTSHAILFREELLLLESILRGLNSHE